MRNLKDVLLNPTIIDGMIENLGEICKVDVEALISKVMNVSSNPYSAVSVVGEHTLEVSLFHDRESGKYLFDARLFDNKEDNMLNAYLEVLKDDLSISKIYCDDVWGYADWEELCICCDTDCILSSSSTLESGNVVFSDLRLDLEHNQLDIEHGLLGADGFAKESSWSHSLDIKFCPLCGRELEEV